MKEILFKKSNDLEKRAKEILISNQTEDKDCTTQVKKRFTYHLEPTDKVSPQPQAPQIHIKKTFDTQKRVERFNFQVKGNFYMTYNRLLLKVYFQHTLDIEILWKVKIFSPKKSAVLT